MSDLIPGRARRRSGKPRLAAVVVALASALVMTACGSSGGDDKPQQTPAAGGGQSAPASAGTFPVTVEHKYGSTEVKSEPKKIVTLGLSDHDTVLALGLKPVGAIDWFKEKPYGKWPWAKDLWGPTPPEIVGERDEYNTEKILKLQPDLIIAVYSGMKKEQYDTLSKIAPVVAQPKGFQDYGAPWQDMTRHIGKSLGRAAQTDKLITDIDARFKAAREKHPEFAGKTVTVADNFEPGIFSAFTKTDPKVIFFTELGFATNPKVDALTKPGDNVVDLSAEKLDVVDSDRLIWVTSGAEHDARIKAEPFYTKLKVVTEKRDLFVPYENPDIGAAFSFNTVLSIPYAIDNVLPLLAAKAG
ncbi:iron-siderophore ABC transporter substrate-binding protein [Yinghuangia sp. KLBMP8922]|uniref:Iron-siderophore ABC transporter substrate-binding protein n=2 Tax=Yinghuangia soli TaxID=2908204 RepID=A0AA41PXD6_9ACTN|nr:iron-siderophore ABC transporter substrate-binding protein [Yinghuangia soli]